MAAPLTTLGQRGGTLRATTAHGYRLTLPAAKVFVSALSKTGTFWIKAFGPNDVAPAVDPTNAAIPGNDLATDFIELKDGDTWANGNSTADGVVKTPGAAGPVSTLSIWCELAGDLVLVLQ